MTNVIYVWKPVGITPLEAVNIFKERNREYKYETISYAGRLDPMAEGVLILLVGEENKERNKYLGLNKDYDSEIILGISTDTYDSLGLIEKVNISEVEEKKIKQKLSKFIGKQKQTYPPYSSKAVLGKPLYWWARNNKLSEIKIPKHEIKIYSIKLLSLEEISVKSLTKEIVKKIKNVKGDFRQSEILKNWEKFKKENMEKKLTKIRIRVFCSSGTYIRRIAFDLGEELESGAFANQIIRTKVGDIKRSDCLKLI